jgi:pimeloyl-ACP methyl ester carboxylesterase
MATFVVCHGAWSASWAWKKMRPLMRARGHDLVVPCYTGLGERQHASHAGITLDTHTGDVLGTLEMEDLSNVVLVGHSYGGMVATAVADRARGRISQLVYLDAFVPRDGESLFDLQGSEHRARVVAIAVRDGDGWRVPPQLPPPDTPAEDLAWMGPRRFPQPLATFTSKLHLTHGEFDGPRTYVFCTRAGPADSFRQFAVRARGEPGWTYRELDASHNPHITVPDELMALLNEAAGGSVPD